MESISENKKLQRNQSPHNQLRMDQQLKSLVRLEARISLMEEKLESIMKSLNKIIKP